MVDSVDYILSMTTEVLDRNQSAVRPAPVTRKPVDDVGPRVRGVMQVIIRTLGASGSILRKLQKAATEEGYSPAEFNAAWQRLNEPILSLGSDTPTAPSAAKASPPDTKPSPPSFDPYVAGERLVEQLQAAEDGAWTGAELQARFGLSPAVLHRRRKEGRIVYWRDAQHEFHYPQWQFTPTGALLPGVQEVLQRFHSDDEWRLMSYFLGQRRQLGDQRPLDLLRAGEKAKVLAHAKLHAHENTW